MPKVPHENDSALGEAIEPLLPTVVHGACPVMIVGVQRKINTGNFENIDVYAGLSIPVMAWPAEDLDAFKTAVAEAAELGFTLVSQETATRYQAVKEMQRGRSPK